MNNSKSPLTWSAPALVQDLDDDTLRRGHALLDAERGAEFARWVDGRLDQLETQFRGFATPRSIRRSLR